MDDRDNHYRKLAEGLAEARGVDAGSDVVESYHAIVSTIHGDQSDPVPPTAIRRASALFHEYRSVGSWWEGIDRALARFLISSVDDGPSLAAGLRGDDLRQCTLEIDGIRLDLEIHLDHPVNHEDGRLQATVRGQLDSEGDLDLPMEGVVLDSDSGSMVGPITTDERGRFDIQLQAGAYDLVFKDDQGRHLIGVVTVP